MSLQGDIRDALRERNEAEREREAWKLRSDAWMEAARRAGLCMSCAIAYDAPCIDCLGTGWNGGAPTGFVANEIYQHCEIERDALGLRAETFERQYRQVCADHAEMKWQRDKLYEIMDAIEGLTTLAR